MSGWRYAFSLSKAAVKEAEPPGTVRTLEEDGPQRRVLDTERARIKFPRPSADPADPLNWSSLRKTLILFVMALFAFASNFNSSTIAPAFQLWPSVYPDDPKPLSSLTYLVAVNVLFLGAANIWWVPLSNWAGTRPVLLIGTLLTTLASVWCGVAKSYDSLLAARAFQGIGAAVADTVAPALVGDIFFVDERGRAMAVYTVALCGGSVIGGVSGGYIGFHLGWAYIFWISTAISGACFLGVLFAVPETMYERPQSDRTLGQEDYPSGQKDEDAGASHIERNDYEPFTFMRSLGISGLRGSLFHHFIRPWTTLALPGTWVVMLHYGGLVGGIVTISIVGAQLVAAPPYSWGANAGLINVGGIIGTLIGALYTYVTSDALLRRHKNKSNNALVEPEARLPAMFPALLLATCGFFVFGFCADHPGGNRWVGLEAGFAMISFGLMQLPSIGFNYIIDAYSNRAADCMVMVTIFRAIISFAWTFFVSDWVEDRGAAEPFGIFGMLMGCFSLLTVPLWLLGKRMRIATAQLVTSPITG